MNTRASRHALVVAYHLPPAGGVPVRRPLRVLRQLPKLGWRCSVLTAERPFDAYHPVDPSGMEAIPPVEHELRIPAHAAAERILAAVWRRASRWSADAAAAVSETDEVAGGRLRRWVQDRWLFPDPKRFWARAALAPARELAASDPIDLVWATGFPWSSFRLARDLAGAIGCPYALDYRDAWTANPRRVWDSERQRSLERELYEGAALVTAATDWIRDDLRGRFGAGTRVETMTNGFDATESPEPDPALLDAERCVLTYTGTFNDAWPPAPGDQSPWWLLQALEDLPEIVRRKLRVRLVGRIPGAVSRAVSAGLSDVVEVVPFVPHPRALQYQLAADHLLLIVSDAPGSAGILTGKLVEYAGARRPVIALAPDGEASRIIRTHRLGVTVPPRDTKAIGTEIVGIVERWVRDGRPDPVPEATDLRAEVQTRALAGWLEQTLEAPRTGRAER